MKITATRVLALATYLGLIGWVMAWIIFLGNTADKHVSLFLVLFVTPLLIPLRGVLAGRNKAMIWGTLLALPYSVHGGMVIWLGEGDVWLGWVEVLLSLGYVISASYFVRWRAVAEQQAA